MGADKWMERSARRQKIIEEAVAVAQMTIFEGSDGSVEETNYLTAEVARKFMEEAISPFSSAILEKDIADKS